MIQLSILDAIASAPRARASDPETSKLAASMAVSLQRKNHQIIINYLASIYPRAEHFKQIARGCGLDETEVGRRLGELRDLGLIIPAGTEVMPSHRKATKYRISGNGEQARAAA